jgi:Flp pilus assembly protein TadG
MSLELALLVPALLVVVAFIAGAATLSGARADLDDAAWEASRAASLARSSIDADIAAHQAVERRLAGERWGCDNRAVTVDVSRFEPGGSVAVDVSCGVRLAEAFLFVPGSAQLRSRAVEPLEPYRALR